MPESARSWGGGLDWAGPSVLTSSLSLLPLNKESQHGQRTGLAPRSSCLLPKKSVVFWRAILRLFSATVWGCNCPHELFFPVMSDDSPLVRGPSSPRAESPRHRPPGLVSPLTWPRPRKTFRSSAAPRHAAVSATSRHAGRGVREPSQARSRIPATSPLGLQ